MTRPTDEDRIRADAHRWLTPGSRRDSTGIPEREYRALGLPALFARSREYREVSTIVADSGLLPLRRGVSPVVHLYCGLRDGGHLTGTVCRLREPMRGVDSHGVEYNFDDPADRLILQVASAEGFELSRDLWQSAGVETVKCSAPGCDVGARLVPRVELLRLAVVAILRETRDGRRYVARLQ